MDKLFQNRNDETVSGRVWGMVRGSLRFEYVYDILSYLESRLNIKINYMTVSRYDMLTVGTLTKFFKESGREYFEKV